MGREALLELRLDDMLRKGDCLPALQLCRKSPREISDVCFCFQGSDLPSDSFLLIPLISASRRLDC